MNLAMKIKNSLNGNATSNQLINENLFSISCFRATRGLEVSGWRSDKKTWKSRSARKTSFHSRGVSTIAKPQEMLFQDSN